MESSPTMHQRKSIRLRGFDYTQAGGYFVTLVTQGRECLFGEIYAGEVDMNPLGKIVEECWEEIPLHFPKTTLDAFVIMPNHLHGIIFIHKDNSEDRRGTIYRAPTIEKFGTPTVGSLPTIIRSLKAAVSRRAGRELNSGNIWQRNYYEHVLRNQADYERIANYIAVNTLKWDEDEENPFAVEARHVAPRQLSQP